jgi:ferredoxin-nitrite reductase
VLDAWGLDRFLTEVEAKIGRPLTRIVAGKEPAPNGQDRQAHVGIHKQKQVGKVWAGVVFPVGKMTCRQMRGLAKIARELGDGDIRLTVWQNLLISGIAEENALLVEQCLNEIGLTSSATSVRAGLVACTGNTGCKFAASNTKGAAMAIAEWIEPRVALDSPINIHLTGCPHSCAQHYIGDIGMIACCVPIDASGEDTVEGFHILVGGGFGPDAAIGREIYRDVKVEDCPKIVERMLKAYLAHRRDNETFLAFTRRHKMDELKAMIDEAEASA